MTAARRPTKHAKPGIFETIWTVFLMLPTYVMLPLLIGAVLLVSFNVAATIIAVLIACFIFACHLIVREVGVV